jgi:FkbM family methyltransferase
MLSRIKKAVKILINYDSKNKEIVIPNPNDIIQRDRVLPWVAAKGDETLRLNYDLNEKSVVFDVGGYKGEFATDIFCKYNATIYTFEPIQSFFQIILNKFNNNHKVKVYNYGLGGKDEEIQISMSDNSSSVFLKTEDSETIQLKSIVNFIKENNIESVDLIKINIEGGEYELLEALLENNLISVFKNIQVQFHDFLLEDGKERMHKIQENLSKTHFLTYQFEFVWENWQLK